jgi:hypothetical protein
MREDQSRDSILCFMRMRCRRLLFCKQACAVFLFRFVVAYRCRAAYVTSVFLSDCGRSIAQARTQWCMRRAVLSMRKCAASAHLSSACAAALARRSLARLVAAVHIDLVCKRLPPRLQFVRLVAAQTVACSIAAFARRLQLMYSLARAAVGYRVLARVHRVHWVKVWMSIRARVVQRWWRYTRARNLLTSLVRRLQSSYLLLNRIVCKRCVTLRRQLLAGSFLQRFLVAKLQRNIGLEVFAASVLQRRIRSVISSSCLVKIVCAARASASIASFFRRRTFVADVMEQRRRAAAAAIARCCIMLLRRSEFISAMLYRRRCAAAAVITLRCAAHLCSAGLRAAVLLQRRSEAAALILAKCCVRLQQERVFIEVVAVRFNMKECAARCLAPVLSRSLQVAVRLQLAIHVHQQLQAVAKRLVLHVQQPHVLDVREKAVRKVCAKRIQLAFQVHTSRAVLSHNRRLSLSNALQRAHLAAATCISLAWRCHHARVAASSSVTAVHFTAASLIFAFCLRRNEQLHGVHAAVRAVKDAAAGVLQRRWLIHRSKFKFRARRGIVAWDSVPKHPPKRSVACVIQRAWRCHRARARLHAQRKQVWQSIVLPTMAKCGRHMEDLAASMYTEIILRSAQQAPAPDFSALHAAALCHAQERVMTHRLAQMVKPKNFGGDGGLDSLPAAAAAATAAGPSPSSSAANVDARPTQCAIEPASASSESAAVGSGYAVFSPQLQQLSWVDAVVSPEDVAAAAAAGAAAEAAAIASEAKAAADKLAAAQARIAAAAKAAADAQAACEAQAAAAARAAAEVQRAKEEKAAAQAQAAADAKAAAEAKDIARAQAAAEAKAVAQAILAARTKAVAEARATAAAKSVVDVVLIAAEFKIAALARARAQATGVSCAPAASEQRVAQPRTSPMTTPAQRPAAASSSPDGQALLLAFDDAVAALAAADMNVLADADADGCYFDSCLQEATAFQHEGPGPAAADAASPELQAVIDEISSYL